MIFQKCSEIGKIQRTCYSTVKTRNKAFSNTVLLPRTNFPLRLESQKLVERDEYIYNISEFENLYSWQHSHLSEPEFVLHDGPPYANGQPHMGHAINKILKDTILRTHILQGNKVHYVPGWDCHGLPIELKALSSSSITDPIEIRKKARNFATKTIEEQQKVFKSWGVIGDWKHSYATYSLGYVKTQFKQFFKLYDKNLVYRDVKPIYWSPSTQTALAEAELEYNDSHKSPSAYVRFELRNTPKLSIPEGKRTYALIWTTTPWTLPANSAVCYNESISYSLVNISDKQNELYIIASKLMESVSSVLKCNFEILKVFPGQDLEGGTYVHPVFKDQICPILNSTHASDTKGTGLVHTAPAHGPDDFLVALSNKIPIVDMVDKLGCFKANAGHNLQGKYVLSDGTEAVLELVKDNVLFLGEFVHSYPYDWRTSKPVIIRASKQWFIDTEAIKHRAIEVLENVKIVPNERSEIYKKNLVTQIEKRPYWCISRQRKWGVPIPVFYNTESSEIIISENTISHHCNLLEKYGTDFWWQLSNQELLPESLYPSHNSLEKGQDIMDIWLDSGLSWAKVLEGTKVADMYLEGVDQFNGWFQSSLLTSVALRDKAPYEKIYVHGFAVDEKGEKMSKSVGNVVDPVVIAVGKKGQKPYGIDTMRWWVTCHANQVALASISPNALQSSAEELLKIRSVLRFALGSLADYERTEIGHRNLLLIDRYILHLLYQFHQQVNEYLKSYQFHKICSAVLNLLTNPISALYYTAIKDRLYCEGLDSSTRRAAQYTLLQIFEIVSQSIAPMVPHLAEEMYQHFHLKDAKTYFTSTHLKPEAEWENLEIEEVMGVILNCKRDVNKELGGNTLDAAVEIIFSKKQFQLLKDKNIDGLEHQLTDILQVSEVKVEKGDLPTDYQLTISKGKRTACPRCRRIQSEKEDDLCKRCFEVLHILNLNKNAVSN